MGFLIAGLQLLDSLELLGKLFGGIHAQDGLANIITIVLDILVMFSIGLIYEAEHDPGESRSLYFSIVMTMFFISTVVSLISLALSSIFRVSSEQNITENVNNSNEEEIEEGFSREIEKSNSQNTVGPPYVGRDSIILNPAFAFY